MQSFNAGTSTTYGYDSTGLRVVRTVDGTARLFLYDLSGSRPRVVMEMDGSYTPIAWYVYGLGLLWKVAADSSTYFYHFDGDGNVVALSTPTGGVVNQYRYDPTGRLIASNEIVENMFRARGEAGWMDDGNGLVFTNSLYQFPELRLTLPATADPSPPAAGPVAAIPGRRSLLLPRRLELPFRYWREGPVMRRAAFVLWAAVALSRAVSGQTPVLTPGVATQGHIEPQARAFFGFYANPGDAVLIRLLSLSQDYSLQFTVTWNFGYPTTLTPPPINRRSYSVPNPTPGYPPSPRLRPGRRRRHLRWRVRSSRL